MVGTVSDALLTRMPYGSRHWHRSAPKYQPHRTRPAALLPAVVSIDLRSCRRNFLRSASELSERARALAPASLPRFSSCAPGHRVLPSWISSLLISLPIGSTNTLYINPRRRHDSYYSRDRDTTRQAFARRWRACWRGSWGLAPASVASVSRAAKSVSAR